MIVANTPANRINLVVDTEGNGRNYLREVGVVPIVYDGNLGWRAPDRGNVYHGKLFADTNNLTTGAREEVWALFMWLLSMKKGGRLIFWSDNPAFDWSPLNVLFHEVVSENPFGWSARRIGDLYAGLTGNTFDQSSWKQFRTTPHTHNPVDDAMGNAEALCHILNTHGKGL